MIKNFFFLMTLLSIGFVGVRFAFSKAIRQYFDARMYWSVFVVIGAGFVLHSALLLMLLAGSALLVTASSRLDAICRLAIMVALLPNVDQYITIAGLNLTGIGMTSMLSLAAWIACHMRSEPLTFRKFTADDGIIVLSIALSVYFIGRPIGFSGYERDIVTSLLGIGLCYYSYRRYVQNQTEFGHLIAALAGAAMILAFVAISEARMHWVLYDAIYNNQSTVGRSSRALKMRGGMLRAPASFSDSTAFAIFEVVGMYAVISSRQFFRSGVLWWASIGLTVLGVLAAQSRGADVGLLAGLFVLMVIRRRYGLAVAVAGGAATLVALLLVLAPSTPAIASFLGTDVRAGADQDYRQTLLRRGLEVGMEHPFLGDSITNATDKMQDIKQGDGIVDLVNTYLTIFLCSGIIGLTVFSGLILMVFWKMFALGGTVRDRSFTDLQMFAAGGLSAVVVAIGFTPLFYERNAYWFMLLIACSRGLGLQARRSPAEGRPKSAQAAGSLQAGLVHRWPASPALDPS